MGYKLKIYFMKNLYVTKSVTRQQKIIFFWKQIHSGIENYPKRYEDQQSFET